MNNSDLAGRERIMVSLDGEEIEVFNHVSVSTHHYINSVNGYETFEPDISAGDSPHMGEPEAVTPRVAEWLHDDFSIDVSDHGIDVIDPTDDEVHVR